MTLTERAARVLELLRHQSESGGALPIYGEACDVIEALLAERDRLAEALREIVSGYGSVSNPKSAHWQNIAMDIIEHARSAIDAARQHGEGG